MVGTGPKFDVKSIVCAGAVSLVSSYFNFADVLVSRVNTPLPSLFKYFLISGFKALYATYEFGAFFKSAIKSYVYCDGYTSNVTL